MESGYYVCDIMTRKPILASELKNVEELSKAMVAHGVSSVLIHENKNKNRLLGIITFEDIVYRVIALSKEPKKTVAHEIMTREIVSIAPEKDVNDAVDLMNKYGIKRLPVIDNQKKLVGLVTIKDILRIEPQMFDMIYDKMEIREMEDKFDNLDLPYEQKKRKNIFYRLD